MDIQAIYREREMYKLFEALSGKPNAFLGPPRDSVDIETGEPWIKDGCWPCSGIYRMPNGRYCAVRIVSPKSSKPVELPSLIALTGNGKWIGPCGTIICVPYSFTLWWIWQQESWVNMAEAKNDKTDQNPNDSPCAEKA